MGKKKGGKGKPKKKAADSKSINRELIFAEDDEGFLRFFKNL